MGRLTFRDKLIQVEVEDGAFMISKCDRYDNFDEHGSDWDVPISDLEEAKSLIALLTKAISCTEK